MFIINFLCLQCCISCISALKSNSLRMALKGSILCHLFLLLVSVQFTSKAVFCFISFIFQPVTSIPGIEDQDPPYSLFITLKWFTSRWIVCSVPAYLWAYNRSELVSNSVDWRRKSSGLCCSVLAQEFTPGVGPDSSLLEALRDIKLVTGEVAWILKQSITVEEEELSYRIFKGL